MSWYIFLKLLYTLYIWFGQLKHKGIVDATLIGVKEKWL